MSQNKSLQDFERDHGKINDLKSIRNSKCLFFDKNSSQIIYKWEMNQSEPLQWQAEIEKEIVLQNELASKFKQYLKIIDHAYQVTQQNKIIYMTIQTKDGYTSDIVSFQEINDNIDKFIKFKNIFQHMSDMEKNDPKIFYLKYKNIFYQANQLYLTIFGCIQNYKLPIDRNLNLKKLEEATNKICPTNYKDEKNGNKQHNIQKYREDIVILFQFSILKIENKEISIHEINNKCKEDKELKNIAQILMDYVFKDISIEQVDLSLKQSDDSQQIYQKLLEFWKILQIQLESKLEQQNLELFKKGLDFKLLKELQNKQLQIYISIQKEIYENGNRNDNGDDNGNGEDKDKNKNKYNGNVQEKAKYLILQAEHRQQAINLMQNQNKDPHPNLIYFLNEKELNQLKDNQNLLKLFIQEDKNISANINKYLELLQKISSFALDQSVINNEQLKLIPAENLKTSKNIKIKEFWKIKDLEKQMKTHGVERFEFEKPLDARYFYEKFLLAINNNNPNENPLDYKLKSEQFTLLDEKRKKKYQESILNKIDRLKTSQNFKDQIQFKEYMDAFNESFKSLNFEKQKSRNFLSQLYDQENEGLVPKFKFDFRTNPLNFTKKLYDFQMRQFSRDPLIDPDLKSYLRNFNLDDKDKIYIGYKFNGQQHGLGLSRINQNHLKFGIFSQNQIKWGWEIILKNNNFISFYKGYFLNNQKDGIGIQRQYNYQGTDPIEIDEYVGKFSKDKRDGEGTYKNFESKIVKKGDFKDDKLNGLVNIYQNYDDNIFIGYFKNDKKHGFGKVINSQDNYEILGEYYEDQQTGEHKKQYQDGRTETITYPSKLCSIF